MRQLVNFPRQLAIAALHNGFLKLTNDAHDKAHAVPDKPWFVCLSDDMTPDEFTAVAHDPALAQDEENMSCAGNVLVELCAGLRLFDA